MEATDLHSAVEKLIAPAQEETGEENLTEAVEEIIEPEVEETDDEVIDEGDTLDELEASEEDYEDVDIETEDEVEAAILKRYGQAGLDALGARERTPL